MSEDILLPASLREMIPEIGMDGVRQLVTHCGGMVFKHLPEEPDETHLLVKLLGRDLARRICRIHARCDLYIPRAKQALDAHRNAEIIKRYDAGQPVNLIAAEFRLTERWVRTIINRPLADPSQMTLPLFDS
ncbi:MAG: hypothetical protein HQL74_13705 [Magnetococcales bacterium]|nr:hypothetical protein [Magnetococcales bacterium]MBF0415807.1 hypothetical protein [Magnetococcales bacterium]